MNPARIDIPVYDGGATAVFLKRLETRRTLVPEEIQNTVRRILQSVQKDGDEALFAFTLEFDKTDIRKRGLHVGREEIDRAFQSVPPSLAGILKEAASNIRQFHEKDKPSSWMGSDKKGVILGKRFTALDRVGIYVPGGRAVYPSSLLMAAIPAQAAGVKEIALVSPPDPEGNIHPSILCAARVLGLSEIYRAGGAQAIAALAFGTETIRPVDKIAGPGNVYVAEAKRQVFGTVDIDAIAGPTEIVLIADESANPVFVAADLLAQAEHDPTASAICVTHSKILAGQIQEAVRERAERLGRKAILSVSLNLWGGILLTESLGESVDIVNRLAPEHLVLQVEEPWKALDRIRHAGAVFIGHYAPETAGDYWAGPNHILPTNRTARFSSPLSTTDFMKHSSIISYTKQALKKDAGKIISFARTEGLDGHAEAIQSRIE